METPTSWVTSEPVRSAFALPQGLLGRLAGTVMLRTNRQQELVDLIAVRPGEAVLEIGCGPGGLIRRLCATPAGRIQGVDPSPEMLRMAARQVRAEIVSGRVEVSLGTAARTGLADEGFDVVVSANSVAAWPDLDAGILELRRVTARGGRVAIAWHGGTHPNRIARRLALPAGALDRIETALAQRLDQVARHELTGLTVFTARRPQAPAA